jgi:hypothetical protein
MTQVRIKRFPNQADLTRVLEDDQVPEAGWAIVLNADKGVYEDGVLVGRLVQDEISLEGRTRFGQIIYLPLEAD